MMNVMRRDRPMQRRAFLATILAAVIMALATVLAPVAGEVAKDVLERARTHDTTAPIGPEARSLS
jgi:hypothetical protein